MAEYILKSAVVKELEKRRSGNSRNKLNLVAAFEDNYLLSFINTLEVKEVEECKQPEYSCLETMYQYGIKPRWNAGDTLAYYEFYTDREGEYVLGKVTKVDFDKEEYDWIYTFEDGKVYDEQSLLEEETYKKN